MLNDKCKGGSDMATNKKDKDKELEELKKELLTLVGKEEIKRINKIVEFSYKLDERPQYKVNYNVVGGRNHAIEK